MTDKENTKTQENEKKKTLVSSDNIWQAFINVWKNSFDFKGRISRYDYWGFHMMYFLVSLLFAAPTFIAPSLSFIGTIFAFVALLPRISAAVRRLHDTNKSAFWWLAVPAAVFIGEFVVMFMKQIRGGEQTQSKIVFALFGFIFIVYIVLLLFQLMRRGQEGVNKYGEPMAETPRQKKVGKYLAVFMVLIPFVLILIAFCIGVISGYSNAVSQYHAGPAIGISAPNVPMHSQM